MSPRSYTDLVPSTRLQRLGAVCWLLTLLYFVAEPLVAAAWDTPYSFARDTISVLGITGCIPAGYDPSVRVCSPLHGVMNGAFIAKGVLTLVGAVLIREVWPRRRMTTVGLVLIAVAGVSTTATGLFPTNVSVAAHAAASLPQFPAQNAGMLLLGVAGWRHGRGIAICSLLCGLGGLVGTVLFVGATPWGLPPGGMERLALYPLTVWTTVVGVQALRLLDARRPLS